MRAPQSPYRQLQARAKARGIPANQSGAVLQILLDEASTHGALGFSKAVARPESSMGVAHAGTSRVVILGVRHPPGPAQLILGRRGALGTSLLHPNSPPPPPVCESRMHLTQI